MCYLSVSLSLSLSVSVSVCLSLSLSLCIYISAASIFRLTKHNVYKTLCMDKKIFSLLKKEEKSCLYIARADIWFVCVCMNMDVWAWSWENMSWMFDQVGLKPQLQKNLS